MSQKKWSKVQKAMRQIGVSKEMIWRVKEARNYLAQMSSMGMSLLPDFTLHNHIHSDNVVLLLAHLKDTFKFELNEYEAYLLVISAYLHDLGMFFSGERFRQQILTDLVGSLDACPQNRCDRIEDYRLDGKRLGEQIRQVHHLLSAFMLRQDSSIHNIVGGDNIPYLMVICRGHRKANLTAQDCGCYRTELLGGSRIQLGLLASLLRLADALDFYRDRAPKVAFEQRALDFLNSPVALEHWLKHYFVTDPHITRQDQSGNIALVCTANFRVPVKQINGKSYLDFFSPLFKRHVDDLNQKELNIKQYPPIVTTTLGVSVMQATLDLRALYGFRDLPEKIGLKIEESGCQSILDFLQWLRPDIAKVNSNSSLTQPTLADAQQRDVATVGEQRPVRRKGPSAQPETVNRSMGETKMTERYIDFDLHIGPNGHAIARSIEGQASAIISTDVPNHIRLSMKVIEKNQTDEELLKNLGQEFYNLVFPSEIHVHFRQTEAVARHNGAKLRVRLNIEADSLASLPLEFVYRTLGGYFLACNPDTVISRYLNLPLPLDRVRRREGSLHLLAIVANPSDQAPLDPDKWESIITQALAGPIEESQITVQTVKKATFNEIRDALFRQKPDVIQFVGHGVYQGGKGYLALVDDKTGKTWKVDDERFAGIFLGSDDHLGLVSLTTCESAKSNSPQGFLGIAPKIVERGVPAVVAMQYKVLVKTAEIFLENFYTSVAARKPVDWAVQWARNAVSIQMGLGNREFATPVLYMRAKDGGIF